MSEEILPPLSQRLREFIRQELGSNPSQESITPLLGDASRRRYFRYVSDKKESYILTAYPEPFEPETFTYLQMHTLFSELGLPVPELITLDGTLGIVLQEDLGNETLFHPSGESERGGTQAADPLRHRLSDQATAARCGCLEARLRGLSSGFGRSEAGSGAQFLSRALPGGLPRTEQRWRSSLGPGVFHTGD